MIGDTDKTYSTLSRYMVAIVGDCINFFPGLFFKVGTLTKIMLVFSDVLVLVLNMECIYYQDFCVL